MTDLTTYIGDRSRLGGRLFEIAAAVVACHRWAFAMEARYNRLGVRGFQRPAVAFETILSGLEPDRPHVRLGSR